MSGPKWTPAQQAAIADRGGALLVSAAAGSGKTAVLTERAVQLITDPEQPVNADRQSCAPASGRRCCTAASCSPATPCCAASGCCCNARPSAPLTLFV